MDYFKCEQCGRNENEFDFNFRYATENGKTLCKKCIGEQKMPKTKEMQMNVDTIAKEFFGRTMTDSQEKQICVMCGKEAKEFRNEISVREYKQSGICQVCQDDIFGED